MSITTHRMNLKSSTDDLESIGINNNSQKLLQSIPYRHEKILSAVFYGLSSLGVIFINKSILTEYNFPFFNFLATIQFIVTTVILSILIIFKKIEVPMLTKQICEEVIPISIMFLGNVITGLGSTKSLNLPMLTVLRRFSILMTMIGEWFILNNKASSPVVISVGLMISGAIIAAIYDFSYNSSGYFLVLLNNVFTALSGIWLKKASISGKCNKLGVLYYNSLFSAIAMLVYFLAEDIYVQQCGGLGLYSSYRSSSIKVTNNIPNLEVNSISNSIPNSISNSIPNIIRKLVTTQISDPIYQKTKIIHNLSPHSLQQLSAADVIIDSSGTVTIGDSSIESFHSTFYNISLYTEWDNMEFLLLFLFASCCGSILNYATFLCTSYNSALTTSVIGCLKNVVTSYIGMILFQDYHFNWLNFVGVNLSIIGSLYYTYVTLFKGVTGFGSG